MVGGVKREETFEVKSSREPVTFKLTCLGLEFVPGENFLVGGSEIIGGLGLKFYPNALERINGGGRRRQGASRQEAPEEKQIVG